METEETSSPGLTHSMGVIERPTLNPVLREFWTTPARNRILYGGRSSSKSWDAAGFAIFLASRYKIRVLCARQFQNRITESVYTLLKYQIERFGLSRRFNITKNSIISNDTGSEFLFYGLWRSIDEVKSTEGIDILWLEEAHNLTEEQWKVLEPTIRKSGSQIWIIFNPRLATDFAYKRFVVSPPPNTITRKINYDENSFLSQTILDIIENAKKEDYDEYLHVYEGVPKDDDDAVIIKRSWIMAAVDAHLKLGIKIEGRSGIGFDVADSGKDLCAMVHAVGPVVLWADLWKGKEDELLKSCTRVWSKASEIGADVIYDSIGVGATAGAKFSELNGHVKSIKYSKFNAGGPVMFPDDFYSGTTKNKDHFLNIKAQSWWCLGDRFRNTYNAIHHGHTFKDDELISISSTCPHLEKIIDELSTPQRDFDNNGKVKVESKKDLAKRDVSSPNLGDAFVMRFAPRRHEIKITKAALNKAMGR